MSFDRHPQSRSRLHWLLPAFAALLLAGCATGGYYGGGLAGGGYHPGQYGSDGYRGDGYRGDRYRDGQTLHATVEHVDPYRNRIVVARDRRGSRIELRYDRGTELYYRGRRHPVEGLERGDGIRVAAVRSGGYWWARSIEVVHNVREGAADGSYGDPYRDRYDRNDAHAERLRGEVLYVDPRARVIEIGRGHGGRERVRYDYGTVVSHRGRRYRPIDLERGDVVSIELRRRGGGWFAERIVVERDASWR